MEVSVKNIKDIYGLKVEKPDKRLEEQVKRVWDNIAKPLDSLGVFEALTARIAAIQGNEKPELAHKAVVVMCADNGIVEEGISQSGQEVTVAVSRSMGKNRSSVCRMAASIGASVFPVDIGINHAEKIPGVADCKVAYGTRNFKKEPAMTEEETLKAIDTGIKMVHDLKRQGYDIIATGEMGIGNTTTGSAIAAALTGESAESVTGRGAGLSDEGIQKKRQLIAFAIDKYNLTEAEPFTVLKTVGGLDIAGLTGVFIGGAVYHVPVVIDGMISTAAALMAERLCPGCKEYMLPSHMSRENAAKKMMSELGLRPVIDAGLALGEGTGAVMMFSLLDMAMSLYEDKTTFEDIEITQYERFDEKCNTENI